jgi:hypothetical protein
MKYTNDSKLYGLLPLLNRVKHWPKDIPQYEVRQKKAGNRKNDWSTHIFRNTLPS